MGVLPGDVRWLSSWAWRTKWLDRVRLPQLPVLDDQNPGEVFDWGRRQRQRKKPAVDRYLATQTDAIRLACIDDDAFFFFFRANEVHKEM